MPILERGTYGSIVTADELVSAKFKDIFRVVILNLRHPEHLFWELLRLLWKFLCVLLSGINYYFLF